MSATVGEGVLVSASAARRSGRQTDEIFQVCLFRTSKKRLLHFRNGVDAHQKRVGLQREDQYQAAEIWHCCRSVMKFTPGIEALSPATIERPIIACAMKLIVMPVTVAVKAVVYLPETAPDFPISGTGQHSEAVMQENGDDAGHCSNRMTARLYRTSTVEEYAIYRKWMRGVVVLYSSLFLICSVIAIVSTFSAGPTRVTKLSHDPATSHFRTN